ncbi:hypothetical protein [Flavobacterium sp. 3HN19-14]|uniref:hypothetical protein n=1 Tax=Flavobacterium sp. 3HN19-14 TaxID=3448133 RepID=UPI003EE387E6
MTKLNPKKIYVTVIMLALTVITLSMLLKEPYSYDMIRYYKQMSATPPLSEFYVDFFVFNLPVKVVLIVSALLMCFGIYGLIYLDDEHTKVFIKKRAATIRQYSKKPISNIVGFTLLLTLSKRIYQMKLTYLANKNQYLK